jgi:CheY-like chemotaxis protein
MAPRRVLAIDDSLTIRKLLEMALGRAGYALELAASGQEGLQRALRNPPELVLLDYVLPDMKGLEVATALFGDERTARVPVVVMSAKSDDLRPLFRELPSVVDFVGKPFTPSEISFLVADLLARRPGPGSGPASGEVAASPPSGAPFSFAQKEAVAKALFSSLRERFARIPEWAPGLGAQSPAPYFARKILTPDLLDGLLGALVPALREVLQPGGGPPSSGRGLPGQAASLAGQTSVLPLPHLLRELNSTGRTGLLRLEHESRRTFLYLRRGRIVLVSHDQPEEYLRQSTEDLSGAPGDELEKARAAQTATAKPVFVSLAEAGRFPADLLVRTLYQHGKRALLAAIEAGPAGFEWNDLEELPAYAGAYGQPLYLEQIQLERLRSVDDWAQVELHVSGLDLVFRRADDFAARLAGFELTEAERRVLTLVDDRNRVRDVIEKSGATPFEAFHCLFRLSQVGLVRQREEGAALPRPSEAATRPVAILDNDAEGVREPLARLLAGRGRPVRLLEIPTPDDLFPLCLRDRPRLLILDVSSTLDAVAVARRVRSTLEISDTALLAVAAHDVGARGEELRAAGFDEVLVKPFLFADVERLLAA